MRIANVESFLLSCPLPEPVVLNYHGGVRKILKRDAMLIRVTTDRGRIGWAPGQGSEKANRIIRDRVAPFLNGLAIADPDALRVKFFEANAEDDEARKVYCSVEVALYDLVGQERGVPISELIGGRVRDRIKLYGSAGMYMPPEGYAAEAVEMAKLGYRAYKMRPGMGPDEDVETVRQIRAAVGPDFEIMVDAHTWWRMGDRSYTPETVRDLAGRFAEFDIAWLEEPLPPDDHDNYKALRDAEIVPIASGEHEPSEERFLDLIQNECVDYVQADLICQGGYATGRRIFPEVAKHKQRFAFHSWGTDLEVLAAAHLGICWPEEVVEWLEQPIYRAPGRPVMYEFPLANEVLVDPPDIRGGYLTVPKAPGLGMKVNEAVIEKYPFIPGPWSFFTLISPPETYAVTSDHSVPWAGEKDH